MLLKRGSDFDVIEMLNENVAVLMCLTRMCWGGIKYLQFAY